MTDERLKPENEITNPTFNEGDGVAICSWFTGYGANKMGASTLMMKAQDMGSEVDMRKLLRQVRVELSFEEFLEKFFNMYSWDAARLAVLLGYNLEDDSEEVSTDSYQSYMEKEVEGFTLLKTLKTEDELYKLDHKVQDALISLQVKFEKGLQSGAFSEGNKLAKKANINVDNKDQNSENGEIMSEELIKQMNEMKELLKAANDQAALEKTLREAAEAKALETEKDSILAKANVDGDAKALLKGLDIAVMPSIVELLVKSQDEIVKLTQEVADLKKAKEASEDESTEFMTKAMGAEGDGKEAQEDALAHMKKALRDLTNQNKIA